MDEREGRRQAREALRRARDEMREAFRLAWEESGFADEAVRRERFEVFVREVAAKAKQFGTEVGEEARRFGGEFAKDAHKQVDETWRGIRDDWQQRQHGEQRHSGRPEHWLFGGRRFQNWVGGDENANPLLAAMMSKGGWLLSVYVLHMLAEKPRHGNDLMKEIERRTMGGWISNPGAIYPLLSDMESNGLVLSNWEEPDKRSRRIYQITEKGQEEFARLKQVLRPKLMDTIDVLHDIYDDLFSSSGPADTTAEVETAAPVEEPTQDSGEEQEQKPGETSSSASTLIRDGVRSLLDKVIGPAPDRSRRAEGGMA